MRVNDPISRSSREIAGRIVSSWAERPSGFILVAPPLVGAEQVFKLIRDQMFQKKNGADPEKLSVCFLPHGTYRNTKEFVKRVLGAWDVRGVLEQDQWDDLDYLEEGVNRVFDSGRRPIILLPQFHKVVERLSWDLGARLRNLECEYGLSTVVELPVPLSRLRDRWDLDMGKERFICSDFGQGHSSVTVRGYADEELSEMLKDAGVQKEYVDRILDLSGGIPGLIGWLVREAAISKSLDMFNIIVKEGVVEQCARFVEWLDREGDDQFREVVADVYLDVASAEERSLLRQHPWSELLIDRRGRLRASAVGIACMARGKYGHRRRVFEGVEEAVRCREFGRARALLDGCNGSYGRDDIITLVGALVDVASSTNGLSPDWERVERACYEGKRVAGKRSGVDDCNVVDGLDGWMSLARAVRRWQSGCEKKGERLSDFLCGSTKEGDWGKQAVQLIAFRLMQAKELVDPALALKSVIEIPEQTVHVYCAKVLAIPVWAADRLDAETLKAIREVSGREDVVDVKEGERIGFWVCVHIVWGKMRSLPEKDRLFEDEEQVREWLSYYNKIRSPSSHSITMTGRADWENFYSRCLVLVERLSRCVLGMALDDVLVPVSRIIECCLEMERDASDAPT